MNRATCALKRNVEQPNHPSASSSREKREKNEKKKAQSFRLLILNQNIENQIVGLFQKLIFQPIRYVLPKPVFTFSY